jgi:hypothetical protein
LLYGEVALLFGTLAYKVTVHVDVIDACLQTKRDTREAKRRVATGDVVVSV